jgi:hypothetical protein|tara:strand:+ start:330 stop:608 length:279 start_codon:yes stop_codon:yes gene_type:complete
MIELSPSMSTLTNPQTQKDHSKKKTKKRPLAIRGMGMIGALVREKEGTAVGIMKIVMEYKCSASGESILFPGEHGENAWHDLHNYEILSLRE